MTLNSRLSLTVEEAPAADQKICDAHHHIFQRPGSSYFAKDYLADVGEMNVLKTVAVEAHSQYRSGLPVSMQPVGETDFLVSQVIGLKGNTRIAAGIVGYADLTLGDDVTPVLEAHLESGKGCFRGIRNSAAWSGNKELPSFARDPHLYLDDGFRKGFARLGHYGLVFDAGCYHNQLPDVISLAGAFPDTSIVLEHTGMPVNFQLNQAQRAAVFSEWKTMIAKLAAFPNVTIKLGGFGLKAAGFSWNERAVPPDSAEIATAIGPYFLWCIEHLGVGRCMFESNFPVDKSSYSYTVIWDAFKNITRGFSRAEKDALFHDTAVNVYRLT